MRAASPSIAGPSEAPAPPASAAPARHSNGKHRASKGASAARASKPPGSPSLGNQSRRPGSPSLGGARAEGRAGGSAEGSTEGRAEEPADPPTGARNVAPKRSPEASPSMLGLSPTEAGAREGGEPPSLELPSALTSAIDSVTIGPGKVPVPAPVPEAPPIFQKVSLVGDTSGIGADEAYSRDEQQLNNFLRLHPMCSLEATSQRTLQMLSGMFEKVAITSKQVLPVVPKSHDDLFLTGANEAIGERPCVNGDRCLGNFIAQVRYGVDTDMAFTCKEFLLPDQHAKFLAGEGLAPRRGKCLLCSRYFQVRNS